MEYIDIIKILKGMQNPKEDYAEIVGAPLSDMYGRRFVYPEPEDYAIEEAIKVLEKTEEYKWHDLRKDPDDLPEEDFSADSKPGYSKDVLILSRFDEVLVGYMKMSNRKWFDNVEAELILNPIMWKYIELPEEKSVSSEVEDE